MKAAIVDQFGSPPRYGETDPPTPAEGNQVVEVAAASLKNLDRGLASGRHYGSSSLTLPLIPGVDGVVRLGDGSLAYTNALGSHGLMATQTLIDPSRVIAVPPGLDPVLAAAVPNPGLSAWFSLEVAARIGTGHNVLVLGATGVTGSVAVQLAKHTFGASRVVAAGRNTERLQWLRGRGADDVLDLGAAGLRARVAADHAEQPFDVVLDYLWGNPAEEVLAALSNTGMQRGFHATRYVQIGSMAGPDITLPASFLRSAGIELLGFGVGSVPADAQARVATEVLPTLFGMVADGALSVGAKPQPLSDVEQLWAAREPSGTRVVLVP